MFKQKAILTILMMSAVSIGYSDVSENSLQKSAVVTNIGDNKDIKSFLVNSISSIIPYKSQVTIGDIKIDKQGNFIATNILVMGSEDTDLNLSINSISVEGLNVDGKVDGDFAIIFDGLSITNLGSAAVENSIMATDEKNEAITGAANNTDPLGVALNSIGESIYNISLKYDYANKVIYLKLDSTNDKHKFITFNTNIDNVNLYDTKAKKLSSAIIPAIGNGNLGSLLLNVNMSNIVQDFAENVLNITKGKPSFNLNIMFDDKSRNLNINAKGKFEGKDLFDYKLAAKNVNLPNITINDIDTNYSDALATAYVESSSSMVNFDLKFNKTDFAKTSPVQSIFKTLKRDQINLAIDSSHKYSDGKYNSDVDISSKDLASLKMKTDGIVDGKYSLMPYMGISIDSKETQLYDCEGKLCLKSFDISIENKNLLQQLASLTNPNPNTSGQQVLNSYGALVQLYAMQQQDSFVRTSLSSLATFLQKPETFKMSAVAKKPVNQNVVAMMIYDDVNNFSKSNSVAKDGSVKVASKQPNLEFFGKIDQIFNINFFVDGSKTNVK